MRETASNQDLLDAWKGGDELAARVIFDRYLARLTALARSRLSRRLARRLDPEDIVLSAWRSFFTAAANGRVVIPDDDNLWPLLVTLTLRKLSRQSARHMADLRSVEREVSGTALPLLMAADPTPEQAAILTDELESLLNELNPSQRDIVIRRLQGQTQQQIADGIGCSERTVRRTIQHVRELIEQRDTHLPPTGDLPGIRRPGIVAPQGTPAEVAFTTGTNDVDLVVHQMVGQGGVGRVYRATRKSDGHPLALKFLKKRFWSDDRALRSLMNEVDAARRVQHPHIRTVLETGRTRRGVPFLVMEWIEGEDCYSWTQSAQRTVNEIVQLMIPVAEAVSAAHRAGILHCDLKPTNVLRRTDGHVFLTDFGFARDTGSVQSFAGGTAGFLAPEQISSAFGEIGPPTDVYGLGALLNSLLTGAPPFTGRDLAETLALVLTSRSADPPSRSNSATPAILDELCRDCLAKEPSDRVTTADQFVTRLKLISAPGKE